MNDNNKSRYVTPKEAKRYFGVTNQTLVNWADTGKIDYIKTSEPHGKRRYNIDSYKYTNEEKPTKIEKRFKAEKKGICYCRVSTKRQGDDLKRQEEFLKDKYPTYEIIKDIGSGLNYKRRGILSILQRTFEGDIQEVVVAHRDRLCRHGIELFEWLFDLYNVKLTILNEENHSYEEELVNDVLSILHVYSCRINGRRKYTRKGKVEMRKEKEENATTTEENFITTTS